MSKDIKRSTTMYVQAPPALTARAAMIAATTWRELPPRGLPVRATPGQILAHALKVGLDELGKEHVDRPGKSE
jgi:hypothetical protein